MTVKELKQYRSILREIEEINIELKDNSANGVVRGSMQEFPYVQCSFKVEGVMHSKDNGNRLRRLKRLEEQKHRIEEFIYNIEDSITRRIFEYRYIKGSYRPNWERISVLIGGGNTEEGLKKRHNRFLKKQ